MVTPQITLRVPPETLARWKVCCASEKVSVSGKIRELMDEWVESRPITET